MFLEVCGDKFTLDNEEILNHRKNKFLSIGRNKGFTSDSSLSENLSMKENIIDRFKLNFKKNLKIIYIGLLILFVIFSLLTLLSSL